MGGISYCDPECWHGFKLFMGGILFVFGVVVWWIWRKR